MMRMAWDVVSRRRQGLPTHNDPNDQCPPPSAAQPSNTAQQEQSDEVAAPPPSPNNAEMPYVDDAPESQQGDPRMGAAKSESTPSERSDHYLDIDPLAESDYMDQVNYLAEFFARFKERRNEDPVRVFRCARRAETLAFSLAKYKAKRDYADLSGAVRAFSEKIQGLLI